MKQLECARNVGSGRGAKRRSWRGSSGRKSYVDWAESGAEEDKTGRPFVGRSGRYLNEVLRKNGIDREGCSSLMSSNT